MKESSKVANPEIIKSPILWAYKITRNFVNKVIQILLSWEDYIDKTSSDILKAKTQRLLVRSYGTDKIALPLKINSPEFEKYSNLISIVVWNKEDYIEYVNLWYIKATWLDKLTKKDWIEQVWEANADLDITKKIKILSEEKIMHPKFWKISKLYNLIYDEETLEVVLNHIWTLEEEWSWYKDRIFKMKITWKSLMWNSKNNDLSGWSVRTWVDVTKIQWFEKLLKSNENNVSNYRFRESLLDFFDLFEATAVNIKYAIWELLIYWINDPTKYKWDTRKTKKEIINKIAWFPWDYPLEFKRKIAEGIHKYVPFDWNDDDEMDMYRYFNVEEIRWKILNSILKKMGLDENKKRSMAEKLWLWKKTEWILSKEEECVIIDEIFKNEKNLWIFQNNLLRELFIISEKLEEIKSELPLVEKFSNIWDIIVNFWPLLIFLNHDNEYFYNDRYLNIIWLSQKEVDDIFYYWSFSSRVYWWDSYSKVEEKIKKIKSWEAITQNMEITRSSLEKIWVLWNAHKCTPTWSNVWIWMLTGNTKKWND